MVLLAFTYLTFMGLVYWNKGDIILPLGVSIGLFLLVLMCVLIMRSSRSSRFVIKGSVGQIIFGAIILVAFAGASFPFTNFIRAIENSDVCILMIDAATGIEAQDMAIFNLIQRNRKGCVLVVNKWDTIEKDNHTMNEYIDAIRSRLAPHNDLPIVFTSVLKKQRVLDVLDAAAKVYDNYSRKIPTSVLNDEMLPEIENYPPPAWKGKYIKIKYITQLPTRSPSIAFFCNLPQYIRDPYKRYLENKLRDKFDFEGCPLQLYFRQK